MMMQVGSASSVPASPASGAAAAKDSGLSNYLHTLRGREHLSPQSFGLAAAAAIQAHQNAITAQAMQAAAAARAAQAVTAPPSLPDSLQHSRPHLDSVQQQSVSPAHSSRSSEMSETAADSEGGSKRAPKSRRSTKDTSNPESTVPHDYKCPICPHILPNQREFTAHIRGHNEVKPKDDPNDPSGQQKVYYCCLCGKMLSSFSSLDRHMLVHSGERPFACNICGQTFTTNGNMHRHTRTHGQRDSHESDNSSGACSAGSHSSQGQASRTKPGRKRKASVEPPPTLLPPPQPSDHHHRSMAELNVSPMFKPFAHPPPVAAPAVAPAAPAAPFKCPLCPETFFAETLIDAHLATAHPGKTIPCPECAMDIPTYTILKLHKSVYHHSQAGQSPDLLTIQAKFRELAGQWTSPKEEPPILQASPPKLRRIEPPVVKEDKVLDLSPAPPLQPPPQIKVAPLEDLMGLSSPKAPSKASTATAHLDDFESTVDEHEEELKDMKLKGEFPCRHCHLVYPNLRALKGHNKEHMTKAPYACNVGNCTYSSNDKGTLVRHMRNHTGEKPFECTICNFGFTTKANCERHVKNKHGKTSREDVVDSIIIHDTASEGNNDNNTSFTESCASSSRAEEPGLVSPRAGKEPAAIKESAEKKKAPVLFTPYSSGSMFRQTGTPEGSARSASSDKSPNSVRSDETPLDLTKTEQYQAGTKQELPQANLASLYHAYVSKGQAATHAAAEDASRAAAAAAAVQAAAAAASQLQAPYNLPFFAMHNPEVAAFWQLAQQQEMIRKQQEIASKDQAALLGYLSTMQNALARSNGLGGQQLPYPPQLAKPEYNNNPASDSDSENYKMVIKNGVLMKKQKQRRYRTERPFKCEHCAAGFTLRSNMDRHVKQQHPGMSLPSQKDSKGGSSDENVDDMGVDLSELEAFAAAAFPSRPFDTFFVDDHEAGVACVGVNCAFCGLDGLNYLTELKEHILKEHTNGGDLHKCGHCSLWFLSDAARQKHYLKTHGVQAKAAVVVEEDEPLDVESTTDLPFKCHLCEANEGFPNRESAIGHLRQDHEAEYNSLVEKDAFNQTSSSPGGSSPLGGSSQDDEMDQARGRFPDYVNRKVVCLFCMRKFWSAEDLRRHVRTHTGERPYECEVCKRKFTLKHSMLRHRKKHEEGNGEGEEEMEEDGDSEASEATAASAEVKKKGQRLMDKIDKLVARPCSSE